MIAFGLIAVRAFFVHEPSHIGRFFCLFRRLTGPEFFLYNIFVFKRPCEIGKRIRQKNHRQEWIVCRMICLCPVSAGGIFCFPEDSRMPVFDKAKRIRHDENALPFRRDDCAHQTAYALSARLTR